MHIHMWVCTHSVGAHTHVYIEAYTCISPTCLPIHKKNMQLCRLCPTCKGWRDIILESKDLWYLCTCKPQAYMCARTHTQKRAQTNTQIVVGILILPTQSKEVRGCMNIYQCTCAFPFSCTCVYPFPRARLLARSLSLSGVT